MAGDDALVEAAPVRDWKRIVRQRKIWIPAVAGVALVGVVGTAAAIGASGSPVDVPSSATPSATVSPVLTPTPSASPSASAPPSAAPSITPSPEPSPSAQANAEEYFHRIEAMPSGDVVSWMAWSPDSRYVAITTELTEEPGVGNVGVLDPDLLEWSWLEWCGYPASWAHNSNRLAVLGCDKEDATLRIIDERTDTIARFKLSGVEIVSTLAWTWDDTAIIFTTAPSHWAVGSTIYRLDIASGTTSVLDEGGRLAVSPAGDRLAYWTDVNGDGTPAALVLSRSDGSQRKVVVPEQPRALYTATTPVWAPDGSAVAFRYDKDNATTWSVYEVSSGKVRELHSVGKEWEYGQIRWSPEASRLFISYGKTGWVVSRDGTLLAQEKFAHQMYRGTQWTRDGEAVVVEYGGRQADVWIPGAPREKAPLVEGYKPETAHHWSPDGKNAVVTALKGKSLQTYVVVAYPVH